MEQKYLSSFGTLLDKSDLNLFHQIISEKLMDFILFTMSAIKYLSKIYQIGLNYLKVLIVIIQLIF
jgi:hypothetical protein